MGFPDQPVGAPSMLIELLSGLFGYGPETRYLCPAPLYHAAPLRHTMVTIRTGGSAVIMPKFDAGDRAGADRIRADHPFPMGADHVRAPAETAG